MKVYADGGVSEYWIVDPKEMKLVQYRFVDKELQEMITYSHPDTVKSIHFKGLDISTEELFKG